MEDLLVTFLLAETEYAMKVSERGKVCLAWAPVIQSVALGEEWREYREMSDHIASAVGKQRR